MEHEWMIGKTIRELDLQRLGDQGIFHIRSRRAGDEDVHTADFKHDRLYVELDHAGVITKILDRG